jgi:hypothetical protein
MMTLLREFWKSDLRLNKLVGLDFEKNWIFLNAVESFTVETPISSKFIKLIKFELSVGDKMT